MWHDRPASITLAATPKLKSRGMLRLVRSLLAGLLIIGSGVWLESHAQLCVPPEVNYYFEGDCQIGEFYIMLDITSLGDAPSLTVEYTYFGFTESFPGVSTGIFQLGPFYIDEIVDVEVIHDGDPACNVQFMDLEPAAGCPILVACGAPPVTMNYCYGNNEVASWSFEGLGDGSLMITFQSGTIESSAFDVLTIYDGPDDTYPILFQHTLFAQFDLTGLSVVSSANFITMTLTTDISVSCQSGGQTEWSWQVACLDCAMPQASVEVVPDCDQQQFSLEVDITSVGDASTAQIQYTSSGGTETLSGLGVGITTLGPFPLGEMVQVSVLHEFDGLCVVDLGSFTNTLCPLHVVCGEPNIEENYCYGNNDSQEWLYQLIGNDGSLYLQFNTGMIESNTWDQLTIYDGQDANAPILWSHDSFQTIDLTGVAVTSTSGYLYMTMSSDGVISCASNSSWEWEWVVTCLDCSPPVASFSIVQDCDNFQYYIDVNLSSLGSDPELLITNTGGAPEVSATAPGNVLVGPFTSGEEVQLTLVNDQNNLCNVTSAMMVNPLCPTIVCGTEPLVETYCYGGNEDMAWAYAIPGTGTIHLQFNRGTMESSNWDRIRIYDGPDNNSPLLFVHDQTTTVDLGPPGSAINGPGTFYYSVVVVSTGQNLYMELESDGIIHCNGSSTYDPMEWEVSCMGCVPPGVEYVLVPDCEHLTYSAVVEVAGVAGDLGLQITEMTTGESVNATGADTFTFEPFGLDTVISFQVVDIDNSNCTYDSGPLVFEREDCIIRSCGIDNYELCYENNEDRWYTYQADAETPIVIHFLQGHLLPGDYVVVYNSATGGPSDAVLYQGNNFGDMSGITIASDNEDHLLTMRVRSSATGSCDDGTAVYDLRWVVGCGDVGISETAVGAFSMFPNPTNGQLTIQLGETGQGPVWIRVMDMSGRMIREERVNGFTGFTTTLDLGALQSGQYLVHLSNDQWVGIRPLQIVR